MVLVLRRGMVQEGRGGCGHRPGIGRGALARPRRAGEALRAAQGARTWKLAYWRMQNGCATFLVMACSQKTCSGHCTTALLRMRFMAYVRPVDSSARVQARDDSNR